MFAKSQVDIIYRRKKIMSNNVCQSCGMIMDENEYGTNLDGSISEDYCKYCFKDGKFGKDETMEEMIDEKIARQKMFSIFPTLKRWKITD